MVTPRKQYLAISVDPNHCNSAGAPHPTTVPFRGSEERFIKPWPNATSPKGKMMFLNTHALEHSFKLGRSRLCEGHFIPGLGCRTWSLGAHEKTTVTRQFEGPLAHGLALPAAMGPCSAFEPPAQSRDPRVLVSTCLTDTRLVLAMIACTSSLPDSLRTRRRRWTSWSTGAG